MAVRFTMISGLFAAKHMKLGGFCPFSRVNLFYSLHEQRWYPDLTDIIFGDESKCDVLERRQLNASCFPAPIQCLLYPAVHL